MSAATCPAHAMIVGEQPAWGADAVDGFRRDLESDRSPFPCTFAVAAFRQGHLRFAFIDSASDEAAWEPLPELLAQYVTTSQTIAPITSFVVFFRLEGGRHGIDWYEERFWAILQYLHRHDPMSWPADLPDDAEDPRWEFAFAGQPIFVVCNTPAHYGRRSRWNSELTITFQPRSVFQGLEAETVRGEAARRTIRRRLSQYDAPLLPSPVLGGYGQTGNREWRQYSSMTPTIERAAGRCPLHIQPSSAADLMPERRSILESEPEHCSASPAASWRLHNAATPHEVPGWDRLASSRSFYVAADWLRYADTDRVATSRYLGLSADGRLVAALSSHWAPDEVDPDYVATRTLELPRGAPSTHDGVLTLGGRRGFLSGALVAADTPRSAAAAHLADLIRAAAGAPSAEGGAWWWPYLTAPDADLVLAAGSRLVGQPGPGVHLVGADCVIDVVGRTVDDHVAALPTRQRRTNFRREQKRFADSGLEMRRVSLAGHWPQLGPLLAAVQQKYGHQ